MIWQEIKDCIMKEEISVELLHEVNKFKNEISVILAWLHHPNGNPSDRESWQNNCVDKINTLVETEKNVRDKLDLLEAAFIFAGKVSSGPGQFPKDIMKRKAGLRTMKMKEIREDFWGPHMPLLEQAASVQPLMKSVSFMNITKIHLQGSELLKSVTPNDNKHDMGNLLPLFKVLSNEGIQRFEAEWKQVFCDPDSQTVEVITALMGNLDSDKLEDEFSILEEYFGIKLSPDVKHYIKDCMKFPRVLAQVKHIIALLQAFEILNPDTSDMVSTLTEFLETFGYEDEIGLESLHEAMTAVEKIISRYDIDETDEVIIELGQSPELVNFLKEIVNEDIRILIDAVEEHSEQNVSASLVSDLIQVHGFFAPILKVDDLTLETILKTLVDKSKKEQFLPKKISHCSLNVHSLKDLYHNVANREEMTKEIIKNSLSDGVFDISLDDNGICQITMSYKRDGNNLTRKSMSDLHDLRSRAHLIISSNKKHNNEEEINYADFIEQVNLLTDIEDTIRRLQSSGYIKYQNAHHWLTIKETKHLEHLKNSLHEELGMWEESLRKARQQHYYLNYYWSNQLCVLYSFFTNPDRTQVDFDNVMTLIHFVRPNIDKERLWEYRKLHLKNHPDTFQVTPYEIISTIGNALDEIFACPYKLIEKKGIPSFHPITCNASVEKGKLYVAVLDEESPLTVNVMLTLYKNTTNRYPEPCQTIFCSPETVWEEVQIFLRRCFTQSKYLSEESLFCLANVELLTNEVQFELVDFIKKEDTGDRDYQLAIICRGGDHHHIVEEFSKFQHSISGISKKEVSYCLTYTWPDVKIVTSTLPGLGKTEFIHQDAQEKGVNVVTFPISGQIEKNHIIQRLKQLALKDFQCLHFDIGEVDDPVLLDTFLFQLIVTGMVSCGTRLYSLPSTPVYIEIANSLNDRLRESLVITQCFTCDEREWKSYDDLEVSNKITSDIQVVCQYLDALERGRLEEMDIRFSGPQKVKPLSTNRCRVLLRNYYSINPDPTFTTLNTFLGLLADQLRKFSKSAFFEIENLKLMLDDSASGIRSNLLAALLKVSGEFAARSMKSCSSSRYHQQNPSVTSAQDMVQRVEGMIQWEESNHLLVVFHGVDSQTIGAFYRDINRVPRNVSDLLKSQIVKDRSKELDDFGEMSHKDLHEKLERIARTKSSLKEPTETVDANVSGYALTPDNMLKMILIILRVRANVPVIIMGETGCGKTSLVEYLARTCQIPFETYNLHAGRTEEEIKQFIENENNEARKANGQRWVFLDEINTCHHLGLINEIMCHHTLYGRPLSNNLVLLAACNPYKLRPLENATTAGLEGEEKLDEYAKLVYRVHQLPEAMVDYVWDYGSLTTQDEKAYIKRMVQSRLPEYQSILNVFAELLAKSQEFIRQSEMNPFCVSLRDVRRCILLVEWFIGMIKKRAKTKKSPNIPKHLESCHSLSEKYDGKPVLKSIVLALAHCYLSRLQTELLRQKYIASTTKLFLSDVSEDAFSAIVRMEQEDYLDRMELPSGTARNSALRENVFVMLVSILNRIPVFVVGKPGCSKSLAIQLIRSNLRGKDSKDPFFKTLPHLYVVSYQGSKSSTSEGIREIFQKASNYKSHNKNANVLPVVLLDEVGLAENSPNNPLKVLHSILEPGKGKLPEVAVVGISNWALDAAKMNRAIHLSRPEPTEKDLAETAISLYEDDNKSEGANVLTMSVLNCLASAYYEYQSRQGHANFHGLRDYYSLIKSLRCNEVDRISVALQRNFGGIPIESSRVEEIFIDKLKSYGLTSGEDVRISVTKLIQENLNDQKARHLMLITNGDSAIGILKQHFSQTAKETIAIIGSRFEEDISDDYNYRMLSRIILCMERDCVLILRDLECIYGSLYDMLNQNYSLVGKRKNCRVALGANSNPMCYVNDGFRCIVLVDYDEVDYSDPPFLNRFEKQLLRFSDVLNERQGKIIAELRLWVRQMSSVEDLEEQFKESDMFMGFHDDTLPSLVLLHSNDTDEPNEVIVKKCKDDLMWIATPDGVLRTQRCERLKENSREVVMLAKEYFEKPIHDGLTTYMTDVVQDFAYSRGDEVGSKIIVMTYATVHTDINQCLNDATTTYQLERLGAYKSEKQLEERIHNFFFSSDKEWLVLQCKPELDGEHMLLARSVIEDKWNSYAKGNNVSISIKRRKHVCILVHIRRGVKESTVRWQFNFLSGWKQVFLDALDVPSIAVSEMRNETIDSLLTSQVWPFRDFAVKCIVWCFSRIRYTQSPRRKESILEVAKKLFESDNVTAAIQKLVVQHACPITDEVSGVEGGSWQVKVACNLELLLNSSTLSLAMEQYLSSLIQQPLTKIVYFLERENAWPPHLFSSTHEDEFEEVWCDLLLNSSIFNINEIPECLGTDSYSITGARLDLRVPFSQVIFNGTHAAGSLVMEEYIQAMENEENFEENGALKDIVRLEQLQRYAEIFRNLAPSIHKLPESCLNSYMADIFEITSADFNKIDNLQHTPFSSCAFLSFAEQWLPVEDKDPLQFYALLHLFVWTSRGKVLDILELVACCQSKLPVYQNSFNNLTKDFFSAKQFLLPVVENELIDERFDMIWTNTKSTTIYSHGENSDSKANHSRENDNDYSSSENESDENTEKDKDSDRIVSNEDEEIYFEDILVHFVCKKMFPSEKTVVENGGLDSWIQNCYLLLQLARKVDKNNPAYLFLRFCFDYAKVVQTTGISREYQYVLSRIANKLEPKYLEADNSFQIITEELIEPVKNQLRGQEENFDALQKFLSQFYSCCAEVNVETRSAASVRLIFENVLSLYGEKVFVMTPVIYRLLFTEEMRSPGIFLDIIITKDVNYNHSYLSVIDDVFKKHLENGLIHHDSYPAVMICDLIHFIQNFEQCFKMEHLQNSDSKLLKCFRCATNVVTESEDNSGLVLLSSVAFLRAFYRMLSKQPSILITGTPYSHVMSEINSLLATGGTRRLSIQIFFLKQLYAGGMSMFDLRKLCCDSDQLPVMKNLLEQCKIVNKAEFVSVYRLAEYDEVKTAYQHLAQKNEDEMFNILSKCKNSANHRFALLGILINMFYVKKAAGNLSEKEERLVDWFCNHSKDLPSPLKELMIRIVGRANFNHRGLRISLASSTEEIETALLILHIACVVASCGESEISPLLQYLITPEKCHGTCILVHSEGRKRRIFDQFMLCNKSRPATCTCGLRVKHKHDQERYLCPYCGTEIVGEECEPGNLSQQMNFYRLETNTEWEECTGNMDTSVYRALDLIVFACFYAGVATGILSNEAVSSLLRPGKEVSTGRRTGEDIVDVCFDRIKEDLKCLTIILSCQSRPAVDVMHLVVEKCTNLIQGQVVNEGTFSAMEECLAWENKFTEIAEDILPSAIGSARPLSEMFKDSNKDRSSIENEILELDEYPSDSEQQNEELKRLFRLTKEPSFTELRSIFLISSKDFQEQHSLLSVLFSKFDEVSYLACLYPLLQWSRLVSTALTHRISRKEAESKFINDFIDGHRLQQERTEEERHELNKSFRLFRDAWNRMRDFVNKNLDSDVDEMPHLADDSFIGYCLTDGDLSVYLRTAIKILQAIQNNILDELIIKSARTENPALSFLQKSETCYAIMSVSLHEAKDKHIIKFDWSDEFLKYAQNPDYGVGEQIDYDFEQMEIQLANEIVLGKCFLTDSLNPFIFSKELFHSSAKILEKIHEICPQSESLPEDIRKGLHSLNEKRKQDAKNLLQHIEVVIYLLNMKSISSEEARVMTLEKFAETWKTKLPSPFPSALLPEPKASIKLTHIAALYEALEDLLADGTIKGLPSQFRKQLTDETIGLVDSLVDSRNGLIKLKQFLTALRRFVFRYLSAEKFLPEPHTSLRSCLSEPSLWSPDQVPDPDVIPREITLENIYAVITHLQEVIV